MYGMVNQAVRDLATTLGGDPLWQQIRERAGVDVEVFVAMEPYDDAVTYRLVEAASAILGMSPDEVLEAFGVHWVAYTGQVGYGPLFTAMGATLPEFLRNLDAMHTRIALSMAALQPPSFTSEELADGRLRVRYWSQRDGLSPMVRGLLKGLGPLFGLDVEVEDAPDRREGGEQAVFLVSYRPAAKATAGAEAGPAAAGRVGAHP